MKEKEILDCWSQDLSNNINRLAVQNEQLKKENEELKAFIEILKKKELDVKKEHALYLHSLFY